MYKIVSTQLYECIYKEVHCIYRWCNCSYTFVQDTRCVTFEVHNLISVKQSTNCYAIQREWINDKPITVAILDCFINNLMRVNWLSDLSIDV